MTDFSKELEGKAYELVSGTIDLDEFKSWYMLAQAAKVGPSVIGEPQPAEAPQQVTQAAQERHRPKEFEDFTPVADDAEQEEHHRALLGSGPQKPVL